MAGLQKVSGSKIYIGSRVEYKTSVELSDFSGQTWVEIDGWAQTGDLGAEQETITQTLINQNTTIYSKGVISFPIMTNVFVPMLDDQGQINFRAAQKSCKPYAFRIAWGADCGEEETVTITEANPGVVSWSAHGLSAGDPVYFTTEGTLPTNLTPGTIYYVADTPAPDAGTFSVSATPGGAAIDTTGSVASGTIVAHTEPVGETDLFYGFAMYGTKTGGDASATRLLNLPIQPISPAITV